ncbi:MAG: chemotaxis protein, partial [Halothece sp.]
MTQTPSKPEQENQQSQRSSQNGDTISLESDGQQPQRYIPLQKDTTAHQARSSWWQKLVGRWNDISFRNKLTIIVLGSVAVPVVAVTQISVIQTRDKLVEERKGKLNQELGSLNEQIQDDYQELAEESQLMAKNAEVTGADISDPQQAQRVLNTAIEANPNESFYLITNAQGETVAQKISAIDRNFKEYPPLPPDDLEINEYRETQPRQWL